MGFVKSWIMTAGIAAFAFGFPVGAGSPLDATDRCVQPEWSIGERVCLADGLWNVHVGDDVLGTHGPDFVGASQEANEDQCIDSGAGDQVPFYYHCEAVDPSCVDGASGEHYYSAIYARPSDVPDAYATESPLIREALSVMNGIIRYEASLFGVGAVPYALCQDGVIAVANVTLSTTSAEDANIVSELASLGYDASTVKYIVFYNDEIPGLAGYAAGLSNNDSAGVSNPHNGVGYAVIANTHDPVVFAHEYGHTMGAVQHSAPHSNAAHCLDGQDVMCYEDRPVGGANTVSGHVQRVTKPFVYVACVDLTHFDCNHDDYFHPDPPAGSYLATHWNIGVEANLFIDFG